MESGSERRGPWVLISLEGGLASPNPDVIERRKHNSATVYNLEYYYRKYSHDPRLTWDKQILVELDKALPIDLHASNGVFEESVQKAG
jgi:hypothetical protein